MQNQALVVKLINAGQSSFPEAWPGYKACASYDLKEWFRVQTAWDEQAGVITMQHKSSHVRTSAKPWWFAIENRHSLLALDTDNWFKPSLCVGYGEPFHTFFIPVKRSSLYALISLLCSEELQLRRACPRLSSHVILLARHEEEQEGDFTSFRRSSKTDCLCHVKLQTCTHQSRS